MLVTPPGGEPSARRRGPVTAILAALTPVAMGLEHRGKISLHTVYPLDLVYRVHIGYRRSTPSTISTVTLKRVPDDECVRLRPVGPNLAKGDFLAKSGGSRATIGRASA
jgi:hypothetical protein